MTPSDLSNPASTTYHIPTDFTFSPLRPPAVAMAMIDECPADTSISYFSPSTTAGLISITPANASYLESDHFLSYQGAVTSE